MAIRTQHLDIIQGVGLFKAGEFAYGPDVIEIGTKPAKRSATLLALVAGAPQRLSFHIHLSSPSRLVEEKAFLELRRERTVIRVVLFRSLDVAVKPDTSLPKGVPVDCEALLASPSTIESANDLAGRQIELALGR